MIDKKSIRSVKSANLAETSPKRGRRYAYTPLPTPKPLTKLCIAEGCTAEAMSWSRCCEVHYEDSSRWKRSPERTKHREGLNVTPTYVYFIRAGGFVKIGRTRHGIDQRVSDARTFCPFEIEVLACVATEQWVEAALHAAMAAHHERGEWFREHPDVLHAVAMANASPAALEAFARPHAKKLKHSKGKAKHKMTVLSARR